FTAGAAPSPHLFPYTTLFRSHAPRRERFGQNNCASLDRGIRTAFFRRNLDERRAPGPPPALQASREHRFPELRAVSSPQRVRQRDRKSTRLNSSHDQISYAVF